MKENKPTIFGEESFVISNMAEQFYHKEMEFRDGVLFGRIACDFNLDKDKVKRQLELCARLENIDKTELIDMATRKKFADKDYEIKVLQKALELAVGIIFEEYGCSKFDDKTCNKGDNGKVCYQCTKEEYLIRAKEMLENE